MKQTVAKKSVQVAPRKTAKRAAPAGKRKQGEVSLHEITSGETLWLVNRIRAGLPFSALEEFQRAINNSVREVGDLLGIPPRTLVRRKEQGRLNPDESDRLVRYSRLFDAAIELFEGDIAAARSWMQTPKRALGENSPLEMARTELGAREVENLLGRLEHGVFS
jgi:putative toxin-antitoxin system antitoxin component (TIGR02293 family)